jgi:hypothetical protein
MVRRRPERRRRHARREPVRHDGEERGSRLVTRSPTPEPSERPHLKQRQQPPGSGDRVDTRRRRSGSRAAEVSPEIEPVSRLECSATMAIRRRDRSDRSARRPRSRQPREHVGAGSVPDSVERATDKVGQRPGGDPPSFVSSRNACRSGA